MDAIFDSRAFGLMRQSVACAAIALLGVEALLRAWRVEQAAWRARFRILVMALAALLPIALAALPAAGARPLLLDTSLWGRLHVWGWLRLDLFLAAVMWITCAAFVSQEAVPVLRHALRARLAPTVPGDALVAEVAEVSARVGIAPPPVEVIEEEDPQIGIRGVRRPTLVISTGALARLDGDERVGALAHEVAHLKRGDTRRGIALAVLRAALLFNPFALVMFRRAVLDTELACDELAASVSEERVTLGLAAALARFYRFEQVPLGRRGARGPRALLASLEATAHRRQIEDRVEALVHPRRRPRPAPGPVRFTFAALGLGAVLCLIG